MSIKLSYFDGGTEVVRDITPAGVFSLVLTRENHRYKEEFAGEMVITGDDFQWVMDAGRCTEIFVECTFKRVWNGVFTHTDCKIINLSKKYLEVTPRVNDEYGKFEPWMGLEFNIIPPFNGRESRVPLFTVNQYGIERRTVRITEPYDGFVAEGKTWEGYSVNDWIKTNVFSSYVESGGKLNSLISYLNGHIEGVTIGTTQVGGFFNTSHFPWARNRLSKWPSDDYTPNFTGIEASDQDNQLLWLDYSGFMLRENNGDLRDYLSYYREQGGLFTLYEIRNIYSDSGDWQYCDLVYAREFFEGSTPPSGNISTDTSFDDSIRGWVYFDSDKKWYRRPFNAVSNVYPLTDSQSLTQFNQRESESLITGNGQWFSPLIDSVVDSMPAKIQFLKWNNNAALEYGLNWYAGLYGQTIYQNHFHKPMEILKKFIDFIRIELAPTDITVDDISSEFFTATTNPYTNTSNPWKDVLIGQNSDVKRPLASEQATREVMTFTDYLDMLCSLSNTAWAIIDGKLVIEHVSYFEKGLTYGSLPDSSNIINPYSITNTAKNKGFMNLTDAYHFDKVNMPKFELFKTTGGSEPRNNNTRIEYTSACVNNLPRQNIKEILLDTTLDYEYTRSEGSDSGVTFVLAPLINLPLPPPETMNSLLPAPDEFGRFVFNHSFNLEWVVRNFHSWGRNDEDATLNGVAWSPIQPFKNVIQNVAFRYKLNEPLMENPYAIVATGLGFGIIRNLTYETKGHYLEYELGINPIENAIIPETTVDWHLHTQSSASETWTINHEMNTIMLLRPVAFNVNGEEMEYESLYVGSFNQVTVTFNAPVAGTMHFISMNLPPEKVFSSTIVSQTEVTLRADTAVEAKDIALGVILNNQGFEIQPESVEVEAFSMAYVDVIFKFNAPVSATVSICDISGGYITNREVVAIINENTVDVARTNNFIYGKPLVLLGSKEIMYNSHQLITALRRIGFSEPVIASMIVMEKSNT
jgi:hypothetical protein